mmetsp:Transcript_55721/g.121331  ORF Transcript_55721/g.121331 Transcript_55721/m.121331 type:complete len:257 (+) Transcript_55721:932-1702(+)
MFDLVVRLEQQLACPELGQDAAHRPVVDRMRPAETQRDFGRAVLPRAYDRGSPVLHPGRASEVDERHVLLERDARLRLRTVHEEDVFELQVGVRQLQPVQVLDRLEAVGCDARDLVQPEEAAWPAVSVALATRLDLATHALDDFVERGPHPLEHEAAVAVLDKGAQQTRNREALARRQRLLDRGEDLALDLRLARVLFHCPYHLDCDHSLFHPVPHFDHAAEGALTQRATHLVPAIKNVAMAEHIMSLSSLFFFRD